MLSEIREFERSSTTALNAYLQPVVASYLGKLERGAGGAELSGPAAHRAVERRHHVDRDRAPAAGAHRAVGPGRRRRRGAALAKAAGFDNLITCDLGGTSFDVSVIAGGKVAVAAQTTVDFGLVIRTPMIEITTIGAGGGSIASVDRGGLLQVGPESAGSVPGPACYGQGNTRPTLTDAQVVLGRINAARPLGGELKALDVEAAETAIATHVGEPLELDVDDGRGRHRARRRCAHGRRDPARLDRARPRSVALRRDAVRRRRRAARRRADPRDRPECALVPRFPGVTSALGCVLADLRHDVVQTLNVMLDGLDASALDRRMRRPARTASAVIAGAGIAVERTDVVLRTRHALSRADPYRVRPAAGSSARQRLSALREAMIRSAFETAYLASFSRLLPGLPMRIVSLRVAAIGRRPAFDFSVFASEPFRIARQRPGADHDQCGSMAAGATTDIWARLDLPAGAMIAGPAILEQPDATTVIEPGSRGPDRSAGNLIVEPA